MLDGFGSWCTSFRHSCASRLVIVRKALNAAAREGAAAARETYRGRSSVLSFLRLFVTSFVAHTRWLCIGHRRDSST